MFQSSPEGSSIMIKLTTLAMCQRSACISIPCCAIVLCTEIPEWFLISTLKGTAKITSVMLYANLECCV